MGVKTRVSLVALATIALASCGAPARTGPPGSDPAAAVAAQPTILTIGYGAEIDNLASKLAGGVWAADFNFMTNSPLAVQDAQGTASPRLAAELPSRDNGTWVVSPDGTMRTTWKIRPNATWHDGRPVSVNDFVFALAVTLDDAIPIDVRRPEQFMERIEPLDDKTFLIHWKRPYPWANALIYDQLEPLPEHIMGSVYAAGDPTLFINHEFWSSPSYVGSGPYRLVQWDKGTQLVYRAFDDYFLGRAKIDEVIFRIVPDPNTVMAGLLAGELDVSLNITLGQNLGAALRDSWAQGEGGTVLGQPVRFRYFQIQFNPEWLEQPALLDVRVRRAIVHGIDRQSLAETYTAGFGQATDVFLSRNDPLHQRAAEAVAKYPHDPSRAAALLLEAGWAHRGDSLLNARAQRFTVDIRGTEGTDNQLEQNIVADHLRRLGMDASQSMVPRSLMRDSEYRVKFPGLNQTAFGIEVPRTARFGLSDQCPDPNRRYVGGNRGCWTDPEYDRLYVIGETSLDPNERASALVQALKIITEDVGIIPLLHYSDILAFRKGLVGPGQRWPAQGGTTWNVHEWDWR